MGERSTKNSDGAADEEGLALISAASEAASCGVVGPAAELATFLSKNEIRR